MPCPFDSVVYGSDGSPSRLPCGRCFNLEAASRGGRVDFEYVDFSPLTMNGANCLAHVFQRRTRLFGAGVVIDAVELNDDQSEGYHFQVVGEEQGDLLVLLTQLVNKIRRALEQSHCEEGALGLQISDRGTVRAKIESHPEGETDIPVVVIDGRAISWVEFGRRVAM